MIIKRARGHRLYTTDGDKILDLSMDQGRAVLGHRPNGLSLAIKNVIERGLYAPYDNIYLKRLIKDLSIRFPDHPHVTIVNYQDKISTYFDSEILDPLYSNCFDVKLAFWRPFLNIPNSENIVVLYPLPGLNTASVLVSKKQHTLESDSISPVLLSGILRSLYDYDLEYKKFDRSNYNSFKSIQNTELLPPYLILKRDPKEYFELCAKGNKEGIMLNSSSQVAILAPDFSRGEQNKILDFLK
ncbi:MAG: hypothetical protein OCD02_02850 [Spirochaetaceae bacterium]